MNQAPPTSRVYRDGKVAVLISRGFGAGWSTWNKSYPGMLYDAQVVDLLLNETNFDDVYIKAQEICAIKYPDAYISVEGLEVVWIDQGRKFVVQEYDGSEHIQFLDEVEWETA